MKQGKRNLNLKFVAAGEISEISAVVPGNEHEWILGLGIGCNFIIDNRLQPTGRLSIIIGSSHFFGNWVQA